MSAPSKVVLFVHLYNDFSGSPYVLRDAIASLDDDSVERMLFTSQHLGALSGLSLRKIIVPYVFCSNKYLKLIFFLLSQFCLLLLLSYWLIKLRIAGKETILVVNTVLPFAALLSGCLLASRVISYVHETAVQSRVLSRFLCFFSRTLAHERVYVSNFLKRYHNDQNGTVILNGLRSDFRTIDTSQALEFLIEAKMTRKNVLYVGNLRSYKGFRAYVELAKCFVDIKFEAVINATEHEFEVFLEDYLGWPNNLNVVLRPEKIETYYRQAYVVLNLSDRRYVQETFGMTILEGFANACPAIVPSVGGHLEFCDANNSVTADIDSFEEVVGALRKVLNDEVLWRHFAYSAWATSVRLSNEVYQRNIRNLILSTKREC